VFKDQSHACTHRLQYCITHICAHSSAALVAYCMRSSNLQVDLDPGNKCLILLVHHHHCPQEFQSLGALYLQQYLDQLRPFITQQAVANIVKLAAQAPPGWKLPEPITTQPAGERRRPMTCTIAGEQSMFVLQSRPDPATAPNTTASPHDLSDDLS
jgi:hypothetical protein